MKNICIWIFLALIVGLLVGCSKYPLPRSTTTTQAIPPISKPLSTSIFGSFSSHTSPSEINLSGQVDLPDGTFLRILIYVNNQPGQSWPILQDIPIQNGAWSISIKASQNGAPDVLPTARSGFTVLMWQKDDPSISTRYPVFVIGFPSD